MESFPRHRSSILWNSMVICGTIIYGSHVVLLNLCKEDGKIPFNTAAVVVLIELTKLLLSLLMLGNRIQNGGNVVLPSMKQWLLFSVPAVLYTINNNLVVFIQYYMDPASFQVLSNLKVATTVALYKLLLRNISWNKWMAFILIAIAGVCMSYGGHISHERPNHAMKLSVSPTGLCLLIVYSFISALAGIYTEFILKSQHRLHFSVQSVMLYSCGLVVSYIAFLLTKLHSTMTLAESSHSKDSGLFQGFSLWTVAIIISQGLSGIINGYIMKQANNLTRLIVVAASMVVSATLSMILFKLEFNEYFITAFLLVIVAVVLYHSPHQ